MMHNCEKLLHANGIVSVVIVLLALIRRVSYFSLCVCLRRYEAAEWPWYSVSFSHLYIHPCSTGACIEEQTGLPAGIIPTRTHQKVSLWHLLKQGVTYYQTVCEVRTSGRAAVEKVLKNANEQSFVIYFTHIIPVKKKIKSCTCFCIWFHHLSNKMKIIILNKIVIIQVYLFGRCVGISCSVEFSYLFE